MTIFKYTHDYEPDSSALSDLSYNQNTQDLLIEFTSGDKFIYHGVPQTVWDGIRSARSAGAHYHAFVRGQYPGDKIADAVEYVWVEVDVPKSTNISVYQITAEVTATVTETVEVPAGLNDIHDAISAFADKYPGAKVKAIAGA